nr:putative transporter [Quercus suber]
MTEKNDVFTGTHQDAVTDATSSKPTSLIDKEHGFNLELGTSVNYMPNVTAAALSQEHGDYLIQRHGTLDLDPIPSDDPADPYNWPKSKKVINLVCVAFHAMMTTFIASSIIPVFEDIALDLGGTITKASYLASIQILVLGLAPLFWKPISSRYGRRPIWLISTIGALLFNVGCALSTTYSAMATCRAFCAFFISPPMSIGSGVVAETFFKKERGQYMGVWTMLVTLGPPLGPFIFGFVAFQSGNYRWIYWILAIINGVQFIAYLFLGPETRYIRRSNEHSESAFKREYLSFRRIDPKPLQLIEFVQPLFLVKNISIAIPAIAYTFVFGFCSVLGTVEIPQLFVPKFGFNPQQLGLQFLGSIIGTIIGEQLGGRLSDYWVNRRARKLNAKPAPEHRLWLSYAGFLLAMVGMLVFGVRIEQAPRGHWNVTPIIGIAIGAVGNQIVTTVLITYAIDCHVEHAASIGVFVSVIRQTWGFIGPFWFPIMLDSIGGAASGGIMVVIIFACSWVPIAALHWYAAHHKREQIPTAVREGVELNSEARAPK